MWPDPKWLEALSLPTRIVGGVFSFFAAALALNFFGILNLYDFGPRTNSIFILGALFFGFLFLFSGGEAIRKHYACNAARKRREQASARRREEQQALKEETRRAVLAQLDHLTKEELHYLAEALRAGSPSFLGYVRDGRLANMNLRGIVYTPGGTFNQDHFPFTIDDEVWQELLARREEFLARDDKMQGTKPRK